MGPIHETAIASHQIPPVWARTYSKAPTAPVTRSTVYAVKSAAGGVWYMSLGMYSSGASLVGKSIMSKNVDSLAFVVAFYYLQR
jgi:hypothetical protein